MSCNKKNEYMLKIEYHLKGKFDLGNEVRLHGIRTNPLGLKSFHSHGS